MESGELRVKLFGVVVTSALAILVSAAPVGLGSEIHFDGDVYQFEPTTIEGIDYLHLEALASVLRCSSDWDPEGKGFTCKMDDFSLKFLPDNPFVLVNGSLANVPVPPLLHEGKVLIAIPVLAELLGKYLHKDVSWNKGRGILSIGPKWYNIEAVKIAASPTLTQITVEASKPVGFAFRLEKTSLTLDMKGGVFSPYLSRDGPQGLVDEFTCKQLDGLARISFALGDEVGKTDTLSLTDPPKLLVFLSKKAEKRPVKKKVRLTRVCVDPGHGGKDPGAVGPTGYQEKRANLDMAGRLKKKLEKLGLEVTLTRQDDSYVSLRERTEIAAREDCDLFISIHCNAAPRRRIRRGRGVETYFLSEAKTDWARAVEARENAAIRFELPDESLRNLDPITNILWDMAQNEYLTESSHLAECVQVELGKRLPIDDRGVQQAGFYVLAGAYMPAVLVEVAFISNREEEKLLKQKWFRERAMEGLYWGVKRFKESYERKLSR